jgi:hypothetical protein
MMVTVMIMKKIMMMRRRMAEVLFKVVNIVHQPLLLLAPVGTL